ncbi:phospholipid scramblase 2-like [Convolutriloba macropyga]|uniref:phospholipid scramblase 2-like n=1 Tax=Convolutriloba macropyga TaxID=536237 RepID=UPI003F5255DD
MTEATETPVVSIEVPAQQKTLPVLKPGLNWVGKQTPIVGVPIGLEYLLKLDQVTIQRTLETNNGEWDSKSKWYVKSVDGEVIYQVYEEPGAIQKNHFSFSTSRAYDIHFFDRTNREVMVIRKELNSCSDTNCCGCAESVIEAPLGSQIGRLQNDCSVCSPQFSVLNYESDFALMIDGPCESRRCCCSHKFQIRNDEGQHVGRVVSNYLEDILFFHKDS